MFADIGFADDDNHVQRVVACTLWQGFHLFCQCDDPRHLLLGNAHIIERYHHLGDEVIGISHVTAPFIDFVHLVAQEQFDVIVAEDDASDQQDDCYSSKDFRGFRSLTPLIDPQAILLNDDVQDNHACDA